MKVRAASLSILPVLIMAAAAQTAPDPIRTLMSLDRDWRFLKSDASGAEQPGFEDANWRTLDVPHDWSIEGPFDSKNPAGGAGAFLPAGVGWYRKHFTLPASYARRRVFIEFDGVMANSEVWINGVRLGKRPYGYVSFQYEMTGHLTFGEKSPNVLAVRADNSGQPASRWYAGAGIYRHVRLVVTDPVHFEHWGSTVWTSIQNADPVALVSSEVANQGDRAKTLTVDWTILAPDERTAATFRSAAQTVEAGKTAVFTGAMVIPHPEVWGLDHPVLYRAVVRVRAGNTILDDETVPFGIRFFRFEPDTGFWLNGRNLKIKGVALHHSAGALGAAVPLRAWERRLEVLKQVGVNAIRTAHNPAAPEFLDLCDRMGFLVMDEMFDCWTVAKNPYDYHLYFRDWSQTDSADTVRRDRNHPSIVVYSAGNEIHDTPKADLAKEILGGLLSVFHQADATRPVSQALFRPNVSHDYDDGLADMLDVVGQNYRENEILAAHAAKPTRKILGTENGHERRVWLALRDNRPYAGQFLWSGIDYLGESRAWPAVASSSGVLDHTGGMKPMSYERQSWWSDRPMVHLARRVAPPEATPTDPGYEPGVRRLVQTLFSDWTPADVSAHEENVEVYSNCEEVELLLNGKSLGSKPRAADDAPRTWRVGFEPGTIAAIAKNKGRVVANHELRTAGKPAKVLLTADRKRIELDWNDLSTVTATVVDAQGVLVPGADNQITFQIAGPGVIAAVDSADNTSHEAFQGSGRRAFQGWCVAMVKATAARSRFTVMAASAGLAGASLVIETGEGGK